MTPIEAIPKVAELLVALIKRAKDRETQSLVQQIQSHQLVIEQGLRDAYAERDAALAQRDAARAKMEEIYNQTPKSRSGKITGDTDLSTP